VLHTGDVLSLQVDLWGSTIEIQRHGGSKGKNEIEIHIFPLCPSGSLSLRRFEQRYVNRGAKTLMALGLTAREAEVLYWIGPRFYIAPPLSRLGNLRRKSRAESCSGASLCFGRLFVSTLRACICLERTEKTRRNAGDIFDCSQEQSFVRLRRFVKPAYFPNVLQRSSSNFVGSYWRIEVKERLDISAHFNAIV
jgi:hypothetical protein